MHQNFNELIALIEEQFAIGEQLRRNCEKQKKAVLAWDVEGLLREIDTREPWLPTLGELERKRASIVEGMSTGQRHRFLSELITQAPHDEPNSERLRSLQERAHRRFSRLSVNERDLYGLKENLMAHIQEALSPPKRFAVPIYGETGVTAPPAAASGLIHSKA